MKAYGQVSGRRRDDDQQADAAEVVEKLRRRIRESAAFTVFDREALR